MTKPLVKVEGLAQVTRRLKALDERAPDEVKALNREAAERVARSARPLVPIDEGDLLGTVRAGATRRSGYVAAGTAGVPYAGPIHFGWPAHNIEPQPFLTSTLERDEPAIVADYERGIGGLMTKLGL